MAPALQPGDRLLLRPPNRLRGGDIVAFADPRDATRTMIKRVRIVGDAGVEVRGDNPAASTDSRTFGPVARRAIIGRTVYRYAPPERTGRLSRSPHPSDGPRATPQ
jgi:nickel-type superoxide dismutase maturation protease